MARRRAFRFAEDRARAPRARPAPRAQQRRYQARPPRAQQRANPRLRAALGEACAIDQAPRPPAGRAAASAPPPARSPARRSRDRAAVVASWPASAGAEVPARSIVEALATGGAFLQSAFDAVDHHTAYLTTALLIVDALRLTLGDAFESRTEEVVVDKLVLGQRHVAALARLLVHHRLGQSRGHLAPQLLRGPAHQGGRDRLRTTALAALCVFTPVALCCSRRSTRSSSASRRSTRRRTAST